ncbi:MAG: DUF2480 family protein [Cyclobacteriaceae bacterium]
MEKERINRVASSSLVSIDLDDYVDLSNTAEFDIQPALYQGIILKESDFREYIKSFNWTSFEGKKVHVHCSADAIIPTWAYMLVAAKLSPIAQLAVFGDIDQLEKTIIDDAITKICEQNLENAKVVIKGCGAIKNRDYAYFQLTKVLAPSVSSIMYGEPCSTVPVFKRSRR